VTIFGESAGAASVSYQMMIKEANVFGEEVPNLFQRAIMQSGVSTNPWAHATTDFLKNLSLNVARQFGIINDSKRWEFWANEPFLIFFKGSNGIFVSAHI